MTDRRHHGPLTLFEREYEKAIRAGMPAYRASLAAMQATAQHSAPSFDWQTLPPPPMAQLANGSLSASGAVTAGARGTADNRIYPGANGPVGPVRKREGVTYADLGDIVKAFGGMSVNPRNPDGTWREGSSLIEDRRAAGKPSDTALTASDFEALKNLDRQTGARLPPPPPYQPPVGMGRPDMVPPNSFPPRAPMPPPPRARNASIGMVAPGNIDLNNRPIYFGNDGTYGTEHSFSMGTPQGEVLVPQIVNGKLVSQNEAWQHYLQTGENLGTFTTPEAADAYATQLHQRDQGLADMPVPMPSRPNFPAAPPPPISAPPPLQAPPAAAAPQLARLPNGKMIAEGVYPDKKSGSTFTVKAGPNGDAVITPNRAGFMNPANMGPGTIAGGFIKRAIADAAPQVAANVGDAANNLGSAASDLAASSGAALQDLGNNSTIKTLGDTLKGANPFGGLAGMFGGGIPQAPSPHITVTDVNPDGSPVAPPSSFPARPDVSAPNSFKPKASVFDASYDPRVPISSAYAGGWGSKSAPAPSSPPAVPSAGIYEALQAPYKARQDAGKVVTPGLIDWGGMYQALQAPYEARIAREAAANAPPAVLPHATGTVAVKTTEQLPTNNILAPVSSHPTPAQLAQINDVSGIPTAPAYNPQTWGNAGLSRAPLPLTPQLPPKYEPPATIPLTSLGTVDPRTQILPQVEADFNQTQLGHVKQYLMGDAVQGGLLQYLPRLPAYPIHYTAANPPPQGPGQNGSAGQGTIYNNPTKYGATAADRQAHAAARLALMGA